MPSYRRSNLDEFVEIFDEDYFKLLSSYKKILKNRNLLLERIKNKSASINELDFWNESLVLFGSKIIFKRINALKVLNQFIKNCEQKILSKTKKFNLSIKYKCRFLSDDLNEIKQNFSKKIEEYKSIEISAKKTLFGPQRDDVEFLNQSNNLAFSGSRGEQRLAILIEKLAILDYLNKKSQKPIILFDDIFSELDKETSKKIQDYLSTLNAQICISSVAKNLFEKDFLKKTNIIEIN